MKLKAAVGGALFACVCVIAQSYANASEAREPLASPDPPIDVNFDTALCRKAADDALAAGLPSVAVDLYMRIRNLSPETAKDPAVNMRLAVSYIAAGRSGEACDFLDESRTKAGWWNLLKGVALLQKGDTAGAKALLSSPFDPAALDPSLLPWYNLAQGIIKSREKDASAADYFEKARLALPNLIGPQVEILKLRDQLALREATSDEITELRQKMHDLRGQRGGFEAAHLLAVILAQSGRQMEALDILDEELRFAGVGEGGVREQLLLLLGTIAGTDTARGRAALQQILLNHNAARSDMETALGMLCAAKPLEGTAPLKDILDAVTKADPDHPLTDELLLLRAYIAMENSDMDATAADAQEIINRFPASALRHSAMRTLAYISFVRKPPQYRTAANYLSQLRSELSPGTERALVGVLIADSFYLNGDFANASTAYSDAFDEPVPDKGIVFYQMIKSSIAAGNPGDARKDIDKYSSAQGVDPMHRWRAEWNLIHSMCDEGSYDKAFARISDLLANPKLVTPRLVLRFMWLKARLSLDSGRAAETPALCDDVMNAMGPIPDEVVGKDERELIASQTMLLKAQAFFEIDRENDANFAVDNLRQSYPDSVAAQNSYLVQARYLARRERLVDAERLLLALADRYPDSEQAPVALWEAAISAEQRGLDATYREAISLLNRLVSTYPDSDLVFYARLRQGDILRKLNDFGTALIAYEDIVNRFPNHAELYLAQMDRADCIIAQSSGNPARRADGVAIYERLMERQDVPPDFRAEASFKWAFNIDRQGDSSRAIDAYWMTINRFLGNDAKEPLEARGRYWVARAAVELGQLLETAGRAEESRKVYNLIVDSNLPGRALALARLKRLDEPKNQQ
jgi:cellulose synthase operon protein C